MQVHRNNPLVKKLKCDAIHKQRSKRHTKKETEEIKRFSFPPSNPKIGTRDETPPQQQSDCEMNQKTKKTRKKEINR
jgi:hypothetical protein